MKNFMVVLALVLVTITSFDYSNAVDKEEDKLLNVCMYTQQKLGASLQLAIRLCGEIKEELTSKRKERR